MAWRNFPIAGLEDYQGEILDFSLLNRLRDNWTMGSYTGDFTFLSKKMNTIAVNQYLFGDSTNGFIIRSATGSNIMANGILNGSNIFDGSRIFINGEIGDTRDVYTFTIYCCVDDETQKAYLFALTKEYWRGSTSMNCGWAGASNYINSSDCYQLVTGFPIITYTWQSVPSISGKNGILSLPVLIDTDGNPVTNGSSSDFSVFPTEAKVRALADANI